MEHNLIFVPGGGCRAPEHYPKTYASLEDAGFDIAAIEPKWDASFEDLIAQVDKEISEHIGQRTLVLAHSRGANVVMPALAKHQNKNFGIILASPSTTCAEGYEEPQGRSMVENIYPGKEQVVRHLGMRALAVATQRSAEQTAVLLGEQEVKDYPFMQGIAQATAEGFGVNVTEIPDAPHFIDYHDNYIDAVVATAERIRFAM